MQPLQICIGPTIRIGRESWCFPYAGFLLYYTLKPVHRLSSLGTLLKIFICLVSTAVEHFLDFGGKGLPNYLIIHRNVFWGDPATHFLLWPRSIGWAMTIRHPVGLSCIVVLSCWDMKRWHKAKINYNMVNIPRTSNMFTDSWLSIKWLEGGAH